MSPEAHDHASPDALIPVLVYRARHHDILAALLDAEDAAALWALLSRKNTSYEALEAALWPEDDPVDEDGRTDPRSAHYVAIDKALLQMRELNPLLDELWHEAALPPHQRDDARAERFCAGAFPVDISESALSDFGLRVFVGSLATRRAAEAAAADAEPSRAEPPANATAGRSFMRADVDAASKLGIFPRLTLSAFKARTQPAWIEQGLIGPAEQSAHDRRQSVYPILDEAAFPVLGLVDVALIPAAERARPAPARPFTSTFVAHHVEAARRLPERLILPPSASARVRHEAFFDLAARTDLLDRVVIARQRIRGVETDVALACAAVVENEYLGLYLIGVRLDQDMLAPWSMPVRPEFVTRWERERTLSLEEYLQDEERVSDARAWATLLRRRLVTACAATTDLALDVAITLNDEPAVRRRFERIAAIRNRQVERLRVELGCDDDALLAGVGARLHHERGARGERALVYRDRVSGRRAFQEFLRQNADAVRDVTATYVVYDPEREAAFEGAGYDYLWAWDGRRLMGLGASAAHLVEAYAAERHEPDDLPRIRARIAAPPEAEEAVVTIWNDEVAPVAVPSATTVRVKRAPRSWRPERAGREADRERDEL